MIQINLLNIVVIFLSYWLANKVMLVIAARWPNKVTVALAS